MKRQILVGVVGATMVIASLGGCSNNKSATSSSNSGSTSSPKVSIDGKNQNVTGQVSCTASGNNINIGIGDASNGIGAVVTNATPPVVHSVGLGNVNGVNLGFADAAAGQGSAQATKDGKTYKITGTATGVDTNSQQQVTKPFEMDLICP